MTRAGKRRDRARVTRSGLGSRRPAACGHDTPVSAGPCCRHGMTHSPPPHDNRSGRSIPDPHDSRRPDAVCTAAAPETLGCRWTVRAACTRHPPSPPLPSPPRRRPHGAAGRPIPARRHGEGGRAGSERSGRTWLSRRRTGSRQGNTVVSRAHRRKTAPPTTVRQPSRFRGADKESGPIVY